MKNKTVKMILAVTVLAVLCGAYVGVKAGVARQEQKELEAQEREEEQLETLFEAAAEDIKSIGFLIDKKEIIFGKENDSWVKQDEKEFPVNQMELDNMISSITDIESDRILENVESLDEYGLTEPSNTIRITTTAEKEDAEITETETTLNIGDKNASSDQYYVSKDDDKNTVYLVNSAVVELFMKELYDYAEKEDFPAVSATETVDRVTVTGDDISSYVLDKEEDTGFWYIGNGENTEKADSAKASAAASSLSSLAYDTMVDYNCVDKGEYGLDEPYAVITADYQEEVPVEEPDGTEEPGEGAETENAETAESEEAAEPEMIDKQLIITVGDEAANNGRYVQVNDSKQVYTMTEASLDAFLGKTESDFWNLTVNYLSINRLENLEVTYGKETHNVNVSRETSENEDGEETETVSYLLDGKEVEKTNFTTYYNKLINMAGQRRLEEKSEPVSEPEMTTVFTSDDKTVAEVKYYKYDENYYAASVDDKVYLVNKMTVKDMFTAFEKILE